MINRGLEVYEGVARRTTELLADTNWPGSRAHVEGLRNALRDVIGIARHKEREAAAAVAALKGIEADVEDYLQHTGEFSTLGGQRLLRAVREPLLSRERASESK